MIVAIEGLIPDRRTRSAQNQPASAPVHPQIDADAWLREQQEKTTVPQPSPDLDRNEDAPTEMIPSSPHASVPAFVPDTTVPSSSTEKKPSTLRLRV